MTAHRRALLLRAGLVATLAAGALAVTATPAFAAANVKVDANDVTLTVAGSPQTVIVKVTNSGEDPAAPVALTVDMPLSDQGVTVSNKPGECQQSGNRLTCTLLTLAAGATKNLPISLSPPTQSSIPAGQQRDDNGQIALTDGGSATANFKVTLKAQAAQATTAAAPVTEVSGTVNDSAGGVSQPIKEAFVVLTDSAGKAHNATTDANGKFKITSTGGDGPIPAGTVTISATKDGYENSTPKSFDAKSGQSYKNVQIALKLSATASAGAAAPPSGEASTNPVASDAGGASPGAKTGSGSSMFSWLLIVLGGLLVLLGIGAIVLLLRRKNDDDEPDDEPADPRRGPAGGAPAPAYRGAPDPTMVGSPMGAPTMVGRSNANDATAIVRSPVLPPEDPYADPYNPPIAAPRTQMYPSAAPASPPGYGPAGAPGGPGGGPGYGAGGGGGYGQGGGGYDDGYGSSSGYGASRPPADSYGSGPGGGYGAGSPPAGAGGANGYGPGGRPSGGGYGEYSERGGYGEDSTRPYERGGYGPGAADAGYGAGSGGPGAGYSGASPQPGGYGPGGNDPGYGGGSSGPGYGAPANGYEPEPYGGGRNGYAPGGGGDPYGQGGGNGYAPGSGAAGNGYGPGGGGDGYGQGGGSNGYAPGADGGGYGSGGGDYEARGGYGPASGYDRDGYDPANAPRGGYGQSDYDDRGGRRSGDDRGGRRALDWLDD